MLFYICKLERFSAIPKRHQRFQGTANVAVDVRIGDLLGAQNTVGGVRWTREEVRRSRGKRSGRGKVLQGPLSDVEQRSDYPNLAGTCGGGRGADGLQGVQLAFVEQGPQEAIGQFVQAVGHGQDVVPSTVCHLYEPFLQVVQRGVTLLVEVLDAQFSEVEHEGPRVDSAVAEGYRGQLDVAQVPSSDKLAEKVEQAERGTGTG